MSGPSISPSRPVAATPEKEREKKLLSSAVAAFSTPKKKPVEEGEDSTAVSSLWRKTHILKHQHNLKDVLTKPWRFRTRDEEARVRRDLGKIPFFKQLPLQTLESISKRASLIKFAKGSIIFTQGQYLRSIFYILEGEVAMLNKLKQPDPTNFVRNADTIAEIEKYGLPEFYLKKGDGLGEELIINQPLDSNGEPLNELKPPQAAQRTAQAATDVTFIGIMDWDMPAQKWGVNVSFVDSMLSEFFSLAPIQRSIEVVNFVASQIRRQFHIEESRLSHEILDGIVRVATVTKVKEAEILFRQGSAGGRWFLVREGQMDIRISQDSNTILGEEFRSGEVGVETFGPVVSTLRKGDIFGELSAKDGGNGRRNGSAIGGTGGCVVLSVSTDVFDRMMASLHGQMFDGKEWENLISKSSSGRLTPDDQFLLLNMMGTLKFFRFLPEKMVKILIKYLEYQTFEPNEIIAQQGDSEKEKFKLYVILRGTVAVHVSPPNQPVRFDAWRIGAESEERDSFAQLKFRELCLGRNVYTLGHGDSFGERAILSGKARTSTCVAATRVEMCFIPRRRYIQAIESVPPLDHSPEKLAMLLETRPRDRTSDEIHRIGNLVKSMVTFRKIPAPIVYSLCTEMTVMTYGPNDVIFSQGESGTYVGVILSGRAAVHNRDDREKDWSELDTHAGAIDHPSDHNSNETLYQKNFKIYGRVVAYLQGGNVVGESVLYMDPPIRRSSVVAETEVKLIVLDSKALQPHFQILSRDPFFENKYLISALRKTPQARTRSDTAVISSALHAMAAMRSLPPHVLQAVSGKVEYREYDAGGEMGVPGEAVGVFRIIYSGRVAVWGLEGGESRVVETENISGEGEGGEGEGEEGEECESEEENESKSGEIEEEYEPETETHKSLQGMYGPPSEILREGRGIGGIELESSSGVYTRRYIAWEETRVVWVSKDDYDEHIRRYLPSEIYRTAQFLIDQVDAFSSLELTKMASIVRAMVPARFLRGNLIVQMDEPIDALFFVLHGYVDLLMKAPPSKRKGSEGGVRGGGGGLGGGSMLAVTSLGPATMFADEIVNAYNRGEPTAICTYSVVASTDCLILRLNAADLSKLPAETNRKIRENIFSKIEFRSKQMESQLSVRKNLSFASRLRHTAEYHLSDENIRNLRTATGNEITRPHTEMHGGRATPFSPSPSPSPSSFLSPVPSLLRRSHTSHSSRPNPRSPPLPSSDYISPSPSPWPRPSVSLTLSAHTIDVSDHRPYTQGASHLSSPLLPPRVTASAPSSLVADRGLKAPSLSLLSLPSPSPSPALPEHSVSDPAKESYGTAGMAGYSESVRRNFLRRPPTADAVSTSMPPTPDNTSYRKDLDADSWPQSRSPTHHQIASIQKLAQKNGGVGLAAKTRRGGSGSVETHRGGSVPGEISRRLPPRPATVWGSAYSSIFDDPWMSDLVQDCRRPKSVTESMGAEARSPDSPPSLPRPPQKTPRRRTKSEIMQPPLEVPRASTSLSVLTKAEERGQKVVRSNVQLAPWATANRIDRAAIINGPDGRSRVVSIQRLARSAKTILLRRAQQENAAARSAI